MYFLSDTSAAIREIQKYLYLISDRVNTNVPRVAIDGIYGPETEAAVRVFQEIYGLTVSGTVERETFENLYLTYSEALIDVNLDNYVLTDEGFPIALGTQNNDVVIVHLMINELSKTYTDIGYVNPNSSYFSLDSQNAVEELQKIFKVDVTGMVDKLFFERMDQELMALRRLNMVYK